MLHDTSTNPLICHSAYDTLKDEGKRKTYDMTGMTGDEQAQSGGNPFGGGRDPFGGGNPFGN